MAIIYLEGLTFVPSIQKIQDMIEKAWSEGTLLVLIIVVKNWFS